MSLVGRCCRQQMSRKTSVACHELFGICKLLVILNLNVVQSLERGIWSRGRTHNTKRTLIPGFVKLSGLLKTIVVRIVSSLLHFFHKICPGTSDSPKLSLCAFVRTWHQGLSKKLRFWKDSTQAGLIFRPSFGTKRYGGRTSPLTEATFQVNMVRFQHYDNTTTHQELHETVFYIYQRAPGTQKG